MKSFNLILSENENFTYLCSYDGCGGLLSACDKFCAFIRDFYHNPETQNEVFTYAMISYGNNTVDDEYICKLSDVVFACDAAKFYGYYDAPSEMENMGALKDEFLDYIDSLKS